MVNPSGKILNGNLGGNNIEGVGDSTEDCPGNKFVGTGLRHQLSASASTSTKCLDMNPTSVIHNLRLDTSSNTNLFILQRSDEDWRDCSNNKPIETRLPTKRGNLNSK